MSAYDLVTIGVGQTLASIGLSRSYQTTIRNYSSIDLFLSLSCDSLIEFAGTVCLRSNFRHSLGKNRRNG